jgi:trans-aconitate 2-methyltransferase
LVIAKTDVPESGWDVGLYDKSFGFISRYGTDLLELLRPRPGERILDLGCGTGALAAQIAARGSHVIGIDSDPDMVARAQAQYPALRFECADGGNFLLEEPVDAVFSNAALHWMKAPQAVIDCVARALRPGGRFVAEMGADKNVATITEALYQALAELGVDRAAVDFPWYFPRTGAYVALLEAGGFGGPGGPGDRANGRAYARPVVPGRPLDHGLHTAALRGAQIGLVSMPPPPSR